MNKNLKCLISTLKPYKGILYFLALLFFFWGLWKIAIVGDMDHDPKDPSGGLKMFFFARDVTPDWFSTACQWLTAAAAWLIHLFPDTDTLVTHDIRSYFPGGDGGTALYFPGTAKYINIVWGCTGIKQMSIFACIMICYFGPWKKKLWYIPMGWLILTVYNVIRIATTSLLTRGIADAEAFDMKFDSLHNGILRYIYYTIIFLLWVCWEEFINKKGARYTVHDRGMKKMKLMK
jgi:exosortase/archaeosortase family protein